MFQFFLLNLDPGGMTISCLFIILYFFKIYFFLFYLLVHPDRQPGQQAPAAQLRHQDVSPGGDGAAVGGADRADSPAAQRAV